MGEPIRLSAGSCWGSAVCFHQGERLKFATAAHVLTSCGIPAGTQTSQVLMCDNQQRFVLAQGPAVFSLQSILWDMDCDYAEFSSNFPGQPYRYQSAAGKISTGARLHGYLDMPNGRMPDCGVANKGISGVIQRHHHFEKCQRNSLILGLLTPQPHLHGMSGGAVVTSVDGADVLVAILNGSANSQGGSNYVAVQP